jgi:hypothetical protein
VQVQVIGSQERCNRSRAKRRRHASIH